MSGVKDCTCRRDSIESARESSVYSLRRMDSGFSLSTCQSFVAATSSGRTSTATLLQFNNCHQNLKMDINDKKDMTFRRHSDQTPIITSSGCARPADARRRLSVQAIITPRDDDGLLSIDRMNVEKLRDLKGFVNNGMADEVNPAVQHTSESSAAPASNGVQGFIKVSSHCRGRRKVRRSSCRRDSEISNSSQRGDVMVSAMML